MINYRPVSKLQCLLISQVLHELWERKLIARAQLNKRRLSAMSATFSHENCVFYRPEIKMTSQATWLNLTQKSWLFQSCSSGQINVLILTSRKDPSSGEKLKNVMVRGFRNNFKS